MVLDEGNCVPPLIIVGVEHFSAADLHSQHRSFHSDATNKQFNISNSDACFDDDLYSRAFYWCNSLSWFPLFIH